VICTWARRAPALFCLLLLAAVRPAGAAAADRADTTGSAPAWIEGRGENEIVLIHGLGANASIWDDLYPFLSGSFRVYRYELHGHGSTAPLPHATVAAEVAALREWIVAQDLVYPTLVGHGLGGMIAMQYTFDHPADVQRLIMIDAGPRQLADQQQKVEVATRLVEEYDRFVASQFINLSPLPEVNERAVDMALRTDSTTFASLLLSSFDWDLTEELPRQSVPMLVIGSQFYLPEEGSERQYLEQYGFGAARVLNFKRIAQTGHYLMLEKPAYLASVIAVWVRQEELE